MIPPTFQIGDEVLITGPTNTESELHTGERFTIEQIEPANYSGFGLPWYPASSLQLVYKKPLSPMSVTYNYKPDDAEHGTIQVSCPCGRKAEIDPKLNEEPKVGDLVQIVGPDWADVMRSHDPEKAYPIHEKTEAGNFQIIDIGIFPATSLRKLTPEEIKQHQVVPMPAKLDEIQELRRRIHDLEMSLNGFTNGPEPEHVPGISYVKDPIRDRLSAIEKRQEEARKYSDDLYSITETLAERIYALQKRVDFVEKFQREQANSQTIGPFQLAHRPRPGSMVEFKWTARP